MARRATNRHPRRRAQQAAGERGRRPRRRARVLVAAAVLLVTAVLVVVIALPRFGDGGSSDAPAAELLLPEGPARAGPVVVEEPVVDLGHVPLDFPVQHVFRLVNVSGERVQLGRPGFADVLEGC